MFRMIQEILKSVVQGTMNILGMCTESQRCADIVEYGVSQLKNIFIAFPCKQMKIYFIKNPIYLSQNNTVVFFNFCKKIAKAIFSSFDI